MRERRGRRRTTMMRMKGWIEGCRESRLDIPLERRGRDAARRGYGGAATWWRIEDKKATAILVLLSLLDDALPCAWNEAF
jgi:hypothetical protein